MEHFLSILRDRNTGTAQFRTASQKLCVELLHTQRALLKERGIAPESVVPVIILRAAIAFVEPIQQVFTSAPIGVLGLKRNEKTKEAYWYYENLPPLSRTSTVLLLDPMLATGGSAEAAVLRLVERGADRSRIYFLGIIAATEGRARLARHISDEHITVAATDPVLDADKMIVPGLGDFGDRYFGYTE